MNVRDAKAALADWARTADIEARVRAKHCVISVAERSNWVCRALAELEELSGLSFDEDLLQLDQPTAQRQAWLDAANEVCPCGPQDWDRPMEPLQDVFWRWAYGEGQKPARIRVRVWDRLRTIASYYEQLLYAVAQVREITGVSLEELPVTTQDLNTNEDVVVNLLREAANEIVPPPRIPTPP